MKQNKNKNEKFIKEFAHKVKDKLFLYKDALSNTTESSLSETIDRSLLEVFRDWLLDITQYGIITTIILNTAFGWLGWKNVYIWLGIGLGRWLFLDFLSSVVKTIKGNQ